ncbi:MAG: hypothetical protein ACRDYX_00775 [Egibacteraceae bacterium]
MRVLLVAYCFIRENRQSMIGVYKKCMRVANALTDRGHEVVLAHSGGQNYSDELTEKVRRRITTVSLPSFDAGDGQLGLDETGRTRNAILEQFGAVQPDLVVLGGTPLSGMFLEAALCTAELGFPLAILENAYSPLIVWGFCVENGPIADGLVLNGPSSFHSPRPPAHLCQVPPFIDLGSETERGAASRTLGLGGDRLITVLAYDTKVEKIALDLAIRFKGSGCEMVLVSRRPEPLQRRLTTLDSDITTKAIAPPSEPVLFNLLRRSRLAIIKYGFAQLTEALALRTPVLAVYYGGPRWLGHTPRSCHKFVHVTSDDDTGPQVATAARKLMDTDPEEMAQIHTGGFAAAEETARFLEKLYVRGLRDTSAECAERGFSQERVATALEQLERCDHVSVQALRCTRVLPTFEDPEVFALLCRYTAAGEQRTARLKGTVYSSTERARSDPITVHQDRRMRYVSPDRRVVLEAIPQGADVGASSDPARSVLGMSEGSVSPTVHVTSS